MPGQDLSGRYVRNATTLSGNDQERLFASRISLLGLGGLGGPLLEMLARMGFGRRGQGWVRAADGDVFEASNLNRQLFCLEANLETSKADAAQARIRAVNADIDLQVRHGFVRDEQMPGFIAGSDMVLDALGDLPAKLALRRAAIQAGLPVVTAAVAGWTGFISTLVPSPDQAQGPKDKEDRLAPLMGVPTEGAEKRLGVLAPTVWLMAALQCREAVALACGHPPLFQGRMHVVDLADATWERFLL